MFETLTIPSIAPCTLGAFLDTLDKESRANLEQALSLSNREVSHRKVARTIFDETDQKVKIDPETISAHRNGSCRCSRI